MGTARIGYGIFSLFGSYQVNNVLKDDLAHYETLPGRYYPKWIYKQIYIILKANSFRVRFFILGNGFQYLFLHKFFN